MLHSGKRRKQFERSGSNIGTLYNIPRAAVWEPAYSFNARPSYIIRHGEDGLSRSIDLYWATAGNEQEKEETRSLRI